MAKSAVAPQGRKRSRVVEPLLAHLIRINKSKRSFLSRWGAIFICFNISEYVQFYCRDFFPTGILWAKRNTSWGSYFRLTRFSLLTFTPTGNGTCLIGALYSNLSFSRKSCHLQCRLFSESTCRKEKTAPVFGSRFLRYYFTQQFFPLFLPGFIG